MNEYDKYAYHVVHALSMTTRTYDLSSKLSAKLVRNLLLRHIARPHEMLGLRIILYLTLAEFQQTDDLVIKSFKIDVSNIPDRAKKIHRLIFRNIPIYLWEKFKTPESLNRAVNPYVVYLLQHLSIDELEELEHSIDVNTVADAESTADSG